MENFFNKVGASFSNAGKSIANKTNELTESMEINKQIKENREVVQNMYREIGSRYYAEHKDDAMPAYAEQMDILKRALNNLNDLNDKLRVIKGVALCEKCGAEIPADEAFCSKCGAKMPVVEKPVEEKKEETPVAPGAAICASCKSEIPEDSVFCPVCGTKRA